MLTYCDLVLATANFAKNPVVFASGFACSKFQGVFAIDLGLFFQKKKSMQIPKKKPENSEDSFATLQIGEFWCRPCIQKWPSFFGEKNVPLTKMRLQKLLGLCFSSGASKMREKKTGNCLKRIFCIFRSNIFGVHSSRYGQIFFKKQPASWFLRKQ